MPNATIYIRKENEEYWNSLDNKSREVNDVLAFARLSENKPEDPTIEYKTCKNGHLATNGKCLQKDCKYS